MKTDFPPGYRTYYVSDERLRAFRQLTPGAKVALGGRAGDVFEDGEDQQGKAAGNFEVKLAICVGPFAFPPPVRGKE